MAGSAKWKLPESRRWAGGLASSARSGRPPGHAAAIRGPRARHELPITVGARRGRPEVGAESALDRGDAGQHGPRQVAGRDGRRLLHHRQLVGWDGRHGRARAAGAAEAGHQAEARHPADKTGRRRAAAGAPRGRPATGYLGWPACSRWPRRRAPGLSCAGRPGRRPPHWWRCVARRRPDVLQAGLDRIEDPRLAFGRADQAC